MESPIQLTDEDRGRLQRLIGTLSGETTSVEEMRGAAEELAELFERLGQDIDDLSLMYSSVIEHSTGLENELSERNDQISLLIEKMRHFLSPQLYGRITGGTAETAAGNHQRRNLSVFFSDIVGFTELTDTVEPETLSQMLNSYLDEMAHICDRWGGTIDKFIGDAVMIFFGDEDQADPMQCAKDCVCMALEMQSSLGALEEKWRSYGASYELRIRVGINSGYCTSGNFGSSTRVDYTIIGGNVNVASRLEHQCRPGGVLISGSTYAMVRELVDVQSMGMIQVKGVAHPVETYEVIGRRPEITAQTHTMLVEHESGFDLKSIHFDTQATAALEREAIRDSLQRALIRMGSPESSE